MRRFFRKGGKGFTLIELLIAVAIISVLAMIAIPNVVKASRKSRYARAASETRMVTTSAMTYVLDKGVYPTSIGLLRSNGYGGMGDLDPWKIPYELSPVLLGGGPAVSGQDVLPSARGPAEPASTPIRF